MSDAPAWEGVPGAPEHRTVGSHRAWCVNDSEWCYPESELMCPCCHGALGHDQVWFDPVVGPPERVILTNLIHALRDAAESYDEHVNWHTPQELFARFADGAAAQLREVTGGE